MFFDALPAFLAFWLLSVTRIKSVGPSLSVGLNILELYFTSGWSRGPFKFPVTLILKSLMSIKKKRYMWVKNCGRYTWAQFYEMSMVLSLTSRDSLCEILSKFPLGQAYKGL